jgi:hypothetical protein
MNDEMTSHHTMQTWQLIPLPAGAKVIPCKWIFREKPSSSGIKYKARLCARGDKQHPGIDFNETFAPVAKFNTIKTINALAGQQGWKIHHHDIKIAFLNSRVEELIYMQQLPGYIAHGQETHVCQLLRSLYGLKQSPRQCYSKFHRFLRKHSLAQSSQDGNLYYLREGGLTLILVLYVDDLFITGDHSIKIRWLQRTLHTKFEMTYLGHCSKYLGL